MIVNTLPRHSAAEARALASVAQPLQDDLRVWESIHTGGGCMAWETVCDDGAARIWICDDGNTLGDDRSNGWLVGLHPYAEWRDHWQDEAPTLSEALALASLAQAARAFALGFNPNAPLTFGEFVASGRDVENVGAELGNTKEADEPGRIYANSVFLTGTGATGFFLVIGNCEWNAETFGKLERRLYEFAASEGDLTPYRDR